MSLLKFYGTVALLPLAVKTLSVPHTIWKKYSVGKQAGWEPNEALVNLARLSLSKPEELPYRICPNSFYTLVPTLHQGHLSVDSKKEADEVFRTIEALAGLSAGAAAAAIPIARWFGSCFANAGLGTCAKLGVEDLFTLSGLQLLAGAYLVSQIAKRFLIAPVIIMLSQDNFLPQRTLLISEEYTKMLHALNNNLEKPHDDRAFIEAAEIARQFLRLSPLIAKELHQSLALDTDKAKELIIPLETACRQILAKQKLENDSRTLLPLPAAPQTPPLESSPPQTAAPAEMP